ncbi:MAG: glycosyltransferase family 4 protein [Variovorax sp.]|nr:glycosyltransferase family 4 protein [Variovorax sp.]
MHVLEPASVLVANPMQQHSHQLALAMHEHGWLKAYWAGVPVVAPGESPPFWMPESFRRRIKTVDIPADLRLHPLRFQMGFRFGPKILPQPLLGAPGDLVHRVFHWFDAWTAQRVAALRPAVVIAYENSAYHTFAAAKAVGAYCVLDAASVHQRLSGRLLNRVETPFYKEINRRKDAEVELADLVLTCSPMAADSYVAEGVPADKIRPLLLGAQLPLGQNFSPRTTTRAVPRFLFAGSLSRIKSIDLILQAFTSLAQEGLAYELHFVGGAGSADLMASLRATPHATYIPGVPQKELYPLMAEADCLLLPSRFDSFGMVVAEAMACGTPALVSTFTGAKAIIEQTPGSGWIVEPTMEAIRDQVRALLLDPSQLEQARAHARRAAEPFSWQAYRARAASLLGGMLR